MFDLKIYIPNIMIINKPMAGEAKNMSAKIRPPIPPKIIVNIDKPLFIPFDISFSIDIVYLLLFMFSRAS